MFNIEMFTVFNEYLHENVSNYTIYKITFKYSYMHVVISYAYI